MIIRVIRNGQQAREAKWWCEHSTFALKQKEKDQEAWAVLTNEQRQEGNSPLDLSGGIQIFDTLILVQTLDLLFCKIFVSWRAQQCKKKNRKLNK